MPFARFGFLSTLALCVFKTYIKMTYVRCSVTSLHVTLYACMCFSLQVRRCKELAQNGDYEAAAVLHREALNCGSFDAVHFSYLSDRIPIVAVS
jgi:hypothetical protein